MLLCNNVLISRLSDNKESSLNESILEIFNTLIELTNDLISLFLIYNSLDIVSLEVVGTSILEFSNILFEIV